MSLQMRLNQDTCSVTLDDEMTIYTASEIKSQLLDALDSSRELEISLAGVSELDSAGVQIILMLRQEARRQQKELRFIHHSPAVLDVLDILNLVPYLGDPVVMPAQEQHHDG